ncbi:hypothetical protein K1Y77_16185 [Halomonas qaidamensis]|uniref:Uncharacterized protein n=1 Tax=Halomonas qaidamensis TaxID=2866211 RepID=A0ABY6JNU0_9GAMM|nr:hypothetical protein [Halomonas qaidamensis]UYV18961.1 hypothetical protein K1Y77_16185 [Halomonas qaidamensis]
MSMKTYLQLGPRSVSSPHVQPAIIGELHLLPDDLTEGLARLLTGMCAEKDVPLTPLENTEGHIPSTWRVLESMA